MTMFGSFSDTISDKIGNLGALATTDKSNTVSAINEVNKYTVNLGSITASDWTEFFRNACTAFHQISPKTYLPHNVFLSWGGIRYCGQFIEYDNAIDFTITGGGGSTLYCGYKILATNETVYHKYVEYIESQTLVSINSSYAVNDWNLKKIGKSITLYSRNVKGLPDGWTQFGTVPNGYIPQFDFYHYIYSTNRNAWFGLHFNTYGNIDIWNSTGSAISGEIYLNDTISYNIN